MGWGVDAHPGGRRPRGEGDETCQAQDTGRRSPKMIAGTLAFVLAKDKGRFLRIKPIEIEPPRESLRFLRKNNRKRLPMACGAARPIIF